MYIYNVAETRSGTIIASTRTATIIMVIIRVVLFFLYIYQIPFVRGYFMENWGPIIFLSTVIIGFVIFYERKKSDHKNAESKRRFWEREEKANFVRKKDISNLNYIIIPIDTLPLNEKDEELCEYQNTIRHLADRKILNLTGLSNTDLKMEYGVANLPILTEYDDNYTTLVNTIAKWGARFFALNMTSKAITVLEYGISIGSDVSRNYYLLADYYCKMSRPDEIDRLINCADKLDTLMKPSLIKKLQEIRQKCQ